MLATLCITYVRVKGNTLRQEQPLCAIHESVITKDEAFEDFYEEDDDQRKDLMYCFCRSIFWQKIANNESPYDDLN